MKLRWRWTGPVRRRAAIGSIAAAVLVVAGTALAATVINGSLTAGDPDQTGRLSQQSTRSTCTTPKPTPPLFPVTGARNYDLYTFTNNKNKPRCWVVILSAPACTVGQSISVASYSPTFAPANPTTNYLANTGFGTSAAESTVSYSFNAPANANFRVVVHEINPGTLCSAYTLTVFQATEADDFLRDLLPGLHAHTTLLHALSTRIDTIATSAKKNNIDDACSQLSELRKFTQDHEDSFNKDGFKAFIDQIKALRQALCDSSI